MARLNAGRPDDPIHLVLAGPRPRASSGSSTGLVATDARWLTILGPLPSWEVPDFYAALDVFAMPSRTDSFGIVFLEAWANALPVVAAAAGGVPEVVRHGETGLLVPFGDLDLLSDSIARLLDCPDRTTAWQDGPRPRESGLHLGRPVRRPLFPDLTGHRRCPRPHAQVDRT